MRLNHRYKRPEMVNYQIMECDETELEERPKTRSLRTIEIILDTIYKVYNF